MTIITPSPGSLVTDEDPQMTMTAYFVEAIDAPPTSKDSNVAEWIQHEFNMSVGSLDVVKRVLTDAQIFVREGIV